MMLLTFGASNTDGTLAAVLVKFDFELDFLPLGEGAEATGVDLSLMHLFK